jgi:hypothetical protein
MSWLRLTATSICLSDAYIKHIQCLSTLTFCPLLYGSSLRQLNPLYLALNLGFGSLMWSQNDAIVSCSNIHIGHNKVFEHIDMVSTVGKWKQPYTIIPTLLGSDFVVCGNLLSWNDFILSWLRLTAISICIPHPYWAYTKWLSKLIWCPLAYEQPYTVVFHVLFSTFIWNHADLLNI